MVDKREIEPRDNDEMSKTLNEVTDISDMNLDLNKEQKMRTVALMLGIRYYTDTIIKDPAYLQVMIAREKEMQFSNDPGKELWHLRPANVHSVIHCASEFEQFLLGNRSLIAEVQVGDEVIGPADGSRAKGEI